jgi:hypothetical protein
MIFASLEYLRTHQTSHSVYSLTANAPVETVLGSIPAYVAYVDTVESEGRQR